MKKLLTALAVCAALLLPAHGGEAGRAAEKPLKPPAERGKQKAPVRHTPGDGGKEAPKAKAPGAGAAEKQNIPDPGGAAKPENFVIGELMKWDQKLLSLRASFTQEFYFPEAGLKQHIEGTLDYKKPDLLRIEHIKPARQLFYTDKKNLWVYKPEDSQALKTSWAAWKKNQEDLSGIMELGDYASLAEKNDVAVSTGADASRVAVTFTPRSAPAAYKLTLILSATDYFPMEAVLTVEKTLITTKFENVEKNVPLEDEVFRFVPPKGTETLEFNN